MATASISTRFRFGAQPHGSAAAAARHFDTLARLELAGRRPTPAEAREIVTARRAYIRVCVGYARRVESTGSVKQTANDIVVSRTEFRRPRERRSAPSRATIGRDDGDDEPAERRHHVLACGGFAIASGESS